MSKVVYDAVNRAGKRVARFEFFGKTPALAQNSMRRMASRRRNIFAGFHDETGFHPIRASADYSPGRVGEGSRRRTKAKKRKPAAKRATKKRAPRRKRFKNGRKMSRLQAKYFG